MPPIIDPNPVRWPFTDLNGNPFPPTADPFPRPLSPNETPTVSEELAPRSERIAAEIRQALQDRGIEAPPVTTPPVLVTEPSAHLPSDAQARKNMPIYSGVIRYFPDAIAAVAECSKKGGDQHHPGEPLHWDRSKSSDELDALTRHLVEAGTLDSDGIRHSAKVAWRALANLQKEIEAARERGK